MTGRAVAALRRGRSRAEALMVDQCTITRVTGEPGPLDPETGERPPAPTITVYNGRCKVQTFEPNPSRPESGDHVYTVQRYSVHLPVSAPVTQVGDLVEITAAAADPELVGRRYEVVGLMHKSLATARRMLVDEVTR
jgi:hypothetical protein